MTIRKINDTTIRFIITQEDLEENQINLDDLLEHKPQAMNYLRSIIVQAIRQENVRIDGPFTTMQIRVLQDNSICLTLTQGLESNLLEEFRKAAGKIPESDQNPEPESESGTPVCDGEHRTSSDSEDARSGGSGIFEQNTVIHGYLFDSVSDAAYACRMVPESALFPSDLYRDEVNGGCYLVFPSAGEENSWDRLLLALNEFGILLEFTPPSAAFLMEHTKCILKGDAAAQLSRL